MKKILLTLLVLVAASVYVNATAGDTETNKKRVLVSHTNTADISKEKLKADPMLSLPAEFAKYKISEFEFAYLPKGSNNVLGPYVVKGDRFDNKQLSTILANAKPGDRLFFDEIKTTSSGASDPELKVLGAAVIIE